MGEYANTGRGNLYDIAFKALTIGRDVIFDEASICCPPRDDFLDLTSHPTHRLRFTKLNQIQPSLEGTDEPVREILQLESESDSEVDEPESEPELQPARLKISSTLAKDKRASESLEGESSQRMAQNTSPQTQTLATRST